MNIQGDVSDLQKQRLLLVERFRSTIRSFERMLEVEETEAYQTEPATTGEKIAGDSNTAR